MIVIATNNGKEHLIRLLASIDTHGSGGHKVCIVDTGSTSSESIAYIDGLDRERYLVLRTPYCGYDTGAYVWAYRTTAEPHYLFMHDSMEVAHPGWVQDFTEGGFPVCAYAYFSVAPYSYGFDGGPSGEQVARLKERSIACDSSTNAFFGPVFYATREAMQAVDSKYDLNTILPNSKLHQQGMERGWPMVFDALGIPHNSVLVPPHGDPRRVNELSPKLKKYIVIRQ